MSLTGVECSGCLYFTVPIASLWSSNVVARRSICRAEALLLSTPSAILSLNSEPQMSEARRMAPPRWHSTSHFCWPVSGWIVWFLVLALLYIKMNCRVMGLQKSVPRFSLSLSCTLAFCQCQYDCFTFTQYLTLPLSIFFNSHSLLWDVALATVVPWELVYCAAM